MSLAVDESVNAEPRLSSVANRSLEAAGLADLRDKVVAGERLSLEDGLRLYQSTDIAAVGALANLVRERWHGDLTWFNRNLHINATNVCEFHAPFFTTMTTPPSYCDPDSRRGLCQLLFPSAERFARAIGLGQSDPAV